MDFLNVSPYTVEKKKQLLETFPAKIMGAHKRLHF